MPFLPPPTNVGRERVLAYGGPKVGKSACWIDLARTYQREGTPGHFYVLDTDAAVEDMFDEFWPEGREIVTPYVVNNFEELMEATGEIAKAKPNSGDGDWVVVDLVNNAWDWVQIYYAEKIYGMSIEEYLTETATLIHMAKAAKEKGHEREFGDWNAGDWGHMKKIYLGWETRITTRGRAHVFACAEESEMNEFVSKERDVKQFGGTGGKVGFKPRGQNSLGHRFRTTVRVVKRGSADRALVMAGDRYREARWELKNEARGGNPTVALGDMEAGKGFAYSYMRRIAKWRARDE